MLQFAPDVVINSLGCSKEMWKQWVSQCTRPLLYSSQAVGFNTVEGSQRDDGRPFWGVAWGPLNLPLLVISRCMFSGQTTNYRVVSPGTKRLYSSCFHSQATSPRLQLFFQFVFQGGVWDGFPISFGLSLWYPWKRRIWSMQPIFVGLPTSSKIPLETIRPENWPTSNSFNEFN